MVVTKDQIFEFDDLDTLWERVKDLSQTEHLEVRRCGPAGAQAAQGAINETRNDPRFADFIVSVAKHRRAYELDDQTLFRISRKPNRRVRMARVDSMN